MKTWHTYNNNIVNLFAKKLIQNLHFYSGYAISTMKLQIMNHFFRKNIHYIVIICVPSFYQPARSSSFFSCILSSVLWDNFLWMTLYFGEGEVAMKEMKNNRKKEKCQKSKKRSKTYFSVHE